MIETRDGRRIYATFGHIAARARGPHLRSCGKGANRTPLDWAAWPLACKLGCLPAGWRAAGSPAAARRRPRVPGTGASRPHPDYAACARQAAGGPMDEKGTAHVTTMSSAEPARRDFLYIATGAVAAVGAVGALVPLIAQMNPDASTIAAGAPIEVDLAPIADGQVIKVFWRSKPIYINHRTKKQIEEAQNVDVAKLPDPQPDSARVKPGHDQWQVLIGICTHLGSVYDPSGRIRQGPAPLKLALPPYEFVSDSKIRIG